MRTLVKTSLLTLLSIPLYLTVLAQSDLYVELKMSSDRGAKGSVKVYISSAATRSEFTLNVLQLPYPINSVMLIKKSNPDVAYKMDDAGKTYMEIDLKKSVPPSTKSSLYTVKKIGDEKIMGYNCTHITVTAPDGTVSEIWNTKDIPEYVYYKKLTSTDPKHYNSDAEKAIEAAGADGFPVKRIENVKHEGKMTTELVNVDKKPISASLFAVPADYKKTDVSANPYAPQGMSKEDMEKMKEQMIKQHEGN